MSIAKWRRDIKIFHLSRSSEANRSELVFQLYDQSFAYVSTMRHDEITFLFLTVTLQTIRERIDIEILGGTYHNSTKNLWVYEEAEG